MSAHPLAGRPAPESRLIDVELLKLQYYERKPDPTDPLQLVAFGTSGHRGSALKCTFNEQHILAITQAICDWRLEKNITGPVFMGMDTHALSEPAHRTALEVLAGNGVTVMAQENGGFTPTPVISHAILTYNKGINSNFADGIVVTPSHNPPQDGGFKYNPPHGGPADTKITARIEARANELLMNNNVDVRKLTYEKAVKAATTKAYDYVPPYVNDLGTMIDFEAIRAANLRIGADPMGGAGINYWPVIAGKYGLNIEVVNDKLDPTFRFMTLDYDGKIRMDCSSPYAMASLVKLKDRYDIAFGNDTDFDRHGIVTRSGGLMNPNHFLAVAIWYLFQNRQWRADVAVGKTLVSSSLIDRVAKHLGRQLVEVPVGFKWFVEGLLDGSLGFGGEESAGASFLRKDGTVWTTDKDGIIMDLLAVEILAKIGKDPAQIYNELTQMFGAPVYQRLDVDCTHEQAAALKKITPEMIKAETLGGRKITAKINRAPGNKAEIGGIKLVAEDGSWAAVRPSGTEPKYKIYAESFTGQEQLMLIIEETKNILTTILE